jgi:hypothetical protein
MDIFDDGHVEMTAKEFREIITKKIKFYKCHACHGFGYEYWADNYKSGVPIPEEKWDELKEEDDKLVQENKEEKWLCSNGICESCHGVGYKEKQNANLW